jgi:shikimate kinase
MGTSITWAAVASASAEVAKGRGRPAGRRRTAAPVDVTGWERVVLVGFMGSGKSTVGRQLATRLGWSFVDFDEQIEAAAGATVEELFRTRGEAAFRALEAEVGEASLGRKQIVLAPGGGWSLAPGRLEGLPSDTLSVWLRVSPETAVRRATGHGRVRPLLAGDDPTGRARALLAERESVYRRAALHVDAEQAAPSALARMIAEHMNGNRPEQKKNT